MPLGAFQFRPEGSAASFHIQPFCITSSFSSCISFFPLHASLDHTISLLLALCTFLTLNSRKGA